MHCIIIDSVFPRMHCISKPITLWCWAPFSVINSIGTKHTMMYVVQHPGSMLGPKCPGNDDNSCGWTQTHSVSLQLTNIIVLPHTHLSLLDAGTLTHSHSLPLTNSTLPHTHRHYFSFSLSHTLESCIPTQTRRLTELNGVRSPLRNTAITIIGFNGS